MQRNFRIFLGVIVLLIVVAVYERSVRTKPDDALGYVKMGNYYGDIGEISEQIRTRQFRLYLISFFDSICKTCPSGAFVKQIEALNESTDGLRILGVVSDNFSESDLDNLKGNLGLSFEIKRASKTSKSLGRLWSNWLEEATRRRFSHGAFLLSEEGTVGAVLGQQTMDEFLENVVKNIAMKRPKQ